MKIASIVGGRPQLIKVKPIVDELRKQKIKHILVYTGQHYDYGMSKIFFDELDIPKPDYNLEVGSHSHGRQTALMLERIEEILLKEKPDIVVVYGDMNSTLAGALSAVKLNIPIAHVEAGLRSYRLDMPEEINRVLTDRISKFLFCPTKTAVENLKKEGITKGKGVYLVGDVMYDIFQKSKSKIQNSKILKRLNLRPRRYLLLTIHRQENTDNLENLKSILSALVKSGKKIVFPLHPHTKKFLEKNRIRLAEYENVLVIDPVSYLDMLVLEKNAQKILTDSGGVQKEAYWLGIPCITLRKETEWLETVVEGRNILVGANKARIIRSILKPSCSFHNDIRSNYTSVAKSIVTIIRKTK